jgi:hypothetical protein|tara:strand:+ start:3567 stop:3923 length:357 start_codon:yes stop_codon:yes gene_type:complete
MTDKENHWSGTLWNETESVIHKKGSITHKKTGEKRYIAICESKNNVGATKYELLMSLGLIYVNTPDKKFDERSPDISGPVQLDLEDWKFAGWKKESESGAPYTSVSLAVPQKKEDVPF